MKTNKKHTFLFVALAVVLWIVMAITILTNAIHARATEQEFINYVEENLAGKIVICELSHNTQVGKQDQSEDIIENSQYYEFDEMGHSVQIYHDSDGVEHLVEINLEVVEPYFEEQSLDHYAYMDVNAVDTELIPVILEARQRIIAQTSWVDDSLDGWVEDEDGTIIEIVPHFHEVFPDDWEIPYYPSEFNEGK